MKSKFFVILEVSCIVKMPHSPSIYWGNFIFMYHNSLHIMKGSISEDDREKNCDLRSKTDYGQRVKIVLHAICKKDSAISLSEQ